MNYSLLIENLTNPALLFFVLGIIAVYVKSDLQIPPNSSKFISLYLLFAIGFKGGQELSHEPITAEIGWTMLFGIFISMAIPLYTFFLAVTYLESLGLYLHGHMVAVMALMESPAIIMGLLLVTFFNPDASENIKKSTAIRHSLTNGSVLLILGSLLIGYLASAKQAEGIKPFTNDLFKGFLAIFLLDMGITSGRKLRAFFSFGWFPVIFAFLIPLINGSVVAITSAAVTQDPANRFMLAVLAASASYIAVPAAMKISLPKSNPGLFLPMALAVTFPVNITVGMPVYLMIVQNS
jgi:hypothetical protein